MLYKLIAVFLLFLNSQVFFVSAANPLGIRWAQEIFLALLALYSVYYFLSKSIRNGKSNTNDLFIWLIVIVIMASSSVFALIQYDQPLIYGLIESRKTLAILIYFPLKGLIKTGYVDAEKILNYIVMISLVLLCVSLLMKAGLISQDTTRVDVDSLRPDRNSIGRYYLILSYAISLVRFYYTRHIKWVFALLIFLGAIFFILQERQAMVSILLLSCIYILYNGVKSKRIKSTFFVSFMILIVGLVLIYVLNEQLERVGILFQDTLSERILESARLKTLATIWYELKEGYGLLGFGSLSLMWNDGFHRLYGNNFYLADVGIFGTIFRLGVIAIPFMIFVTIKLIVSLREMQTSISKDVITLGYLYAVFTYPVSALLEYRGYFIGVLFCLAVSSSNNLKKSLKIGN